MFRRFAVAIAATLMISGMISGAAIADDIEGRWTTDSGATAEIAPCGGSFCITLRSGDNNGKKIGQMAAAGGGKYNGSITDPADDKTYKGSARLSGNALKMTGCVLLVLCRSQNWTRQ
jgi:uncharacterized protein (DUF2147 family)